MVMHFIPGRAVCWPCTTWRPVGTASPSRSTRPGSLQSRHERAPARCSRARPSGRPRRRPCPRPPQRRSRLPRPRPTRALRAVVVRRAGVRRRRRSEGSRGDDGAVGASARARAQTPRKTTPPTTRARIFASSSITAARPPRDSRARRPGSSLSASALRGHRQRPLGASRRA